MVARLTYFIFMRLPTLSPVLRLLLAVSLTSASCHKPARVEITESRPRHSTEGADKDKVGVSVDEAFPSSDGYRWKLPEGWKEGAASQLRQLNFSFGPNGEGECYMSQVQGSEADNIRRWCKQMGQPEMTDDQVASLPLKPFFGTQGRFVDLSGTYTGAGGAAPRPDYRMLGLIREGNDVTVTVKMTGPAALVAQHAEKFDAFCSSLRFSR